jgi:hypothetical protein
MRDRRRVDLSEALTAHDLVSNQTGDPLGDSTYFVDSWSWALVKPGGLRTAHSDFHGRDWPNGKERRMVDNLSDVRELIESGEWPCADAIKRGLTGTPPAVHVERCANGELYLIDGQLRVMTALWEGAAEIPAYVIDLPGSDRPTP